MGLGRGDQVQPNVAPENPDTMLKFATPLTEHMNAVQWDHNGFILTNCYIYWILSSFEQSIMWTEGKRVIIN